MDNSKEINKSNAVIVFGSSDSNGHTARIAKYLGNCYSFDVIDLNSYHFSYYDYQHANQSDDFIPLMKNILKLYKTIILATPVYWYAMSGIMKVFIDRFTDIISAPVNQSDAFMNKNLMVLSNSGDEHLDYPFAVPFEKTAKYLKMNYLGHQHYLNSDLTPNISERIINKIFGK